MLILILKPISLGMTYGSTSTTTVNPLHPNISTCIFSLLFSYHLLRCWIGEFVWQLRAILVVIIFFIPITWMCDSGVKLYREIRCWSVLGVSGLRLVYSEGSNKVPAYVHANWFVLYDSHLLKLLFLTTSNKYDGRCLVWFQSVHFVLSFVDFNFVKSRNWNYRWWPWTARKAHNQPFSVLIILINNFNFSSIIVLKRDTKMHQLIKEELMVNCLNMVSFLFVTRVLHL